VGQQCSSGEGGLGRVDGGTHGVRYIQPPWRAAQGVCERLEGAGDAGQEPLIKINEPQEPLQLFHITGDRELLEGGHVFAQRSNTLGGDAMAQKINGGGGENALGRINLKAVDVKQLEKLT
jgi:hypothetical protein